MQFILERRLTRPRHIEFLFPLIALALALIFSGILLWIFGANPLETYAAMAAGAFGQRYHISETILRAIPLMLTGLAVGIAFRMLFWNIGAEGQFVWGVIAATWVALFLPEWSDRRAAAVGLPAAHDRRRVRGRRDMGTHSSGSQDRSALPQWAFLPLMIVAAFAAGAIWGLIPAVLKTALRVNEIITTLMFNYVALLWMQYLYTGSWKDPEGFGFPGSAQFPQHAWLPRLPIDLGRVHYGLVIAIGVAFLIWLVLDRTKWGLEIKVIGKNPLAARYAGMDITRNVLLVMCISGGVAGLAGFSQVAGVGHRLQNGIAVGDGFTAIIVAWLAKLNPWAILLVSILLAGLSTGGDQLQITMGLPAAVSGVLQGSILFFVLGADVFINYRLRIIRSQPQQGAGPASVSQGPTPAD